MTTIKGTIKKINETQQVTDSFKKREFVVETQDQYPQTYLIEFTQDNVTKLDNFKEGQNVDVSYNLRGREWTSPEGKTMYFTTINAWKIEEGISEPVAIDEDDDLPF